MAPPPEGKSIGFAKIAVIALFVIMLAGAVLVRVLGDADAPVTTEVVGSSDESALPDGASTGRLSAGSIAPDFALSDLRGNQVRLSDLAGRPVLINFWATWCGPCEVEMPIIEAAFQAHREDELAVLAIAVDDNPDAVQRFFDERALTFHPLLDDGTGSRAYQVFGLPTSYFVAADGKIAAVHMGLLTEDKIETYLAQTQRTAEQ
jgi:thiol-disulfide isomerase/thioredoxin